MGWGKLTGSLRTSLHNRVELRGVDGEEDSYIPLDDGEAQGDHAFKQSSTQAMEDAQLFVRGGALRP